MDRLREIHTAFAMLLAVALTGCATSRSELDITAPSLAATSATANTSKSIYVEAVADVRQFELKPSEPNIPSLDPAEEQNDAIRLRAVGRKRNTYGMGLGDILLREGQTVPELIKSSVQDSFRQKGYRIVESKADVTSDTDLVLVRIDKFWSWMNPGFWSLTLSSEISTWMEIDKSGGKRQLTTEVKSSDQFQTGVESNWLEVINAALKAYSAKLAEQIE